MNNLVSHLLGVSLRSLPLAMAAVAVLRIPRLRSAAWAHAVWTVVLLSMFALLVLEPALRPIPLRVLPAPTAAQTSAALQKNLVFESLPPLTIARTASARGVAAPPPTRRLTADDFLFGVYLSVAAVLLARLLVGSLLARRLLAGSTRAGENFHESPRVAVPLTIGWLRPVILLPSSWRTWDSSKLEAVLLHESSHIRRRDSLIALLAGLNRCLFWFHPLAWWTERKLAFLAEQACDEACVCALDNRREYARLLLEMAEAVETSGGRISGHALAMARPSQVHRRIDAILDDTRKAHRGLTTLGWSALLLCGVPIVYAAGSMRIEAKLPLPPPQQPSAPTITPAAPPGIPPRPKPILIAQAPAPAPRQPEIAEAPAPVFLPVSVLDPAGRRVTGLEAGNFRITEGPLEYLVTAFEVAEGKHAVVVLNTTGANGGALDALRKSLDPRDESFAADGPPASDADGFWEAIDTAVTEVKQKANPVKAVVVVMQGGLNNPWAPERNISRVLRLALRAPRVSVSFANIEDVTAAVTAPPTYSQLDDTRIVAGASGGQVVPVARPEEMTTVLTRIGLDLRYQYLLGIVPPKGKPDALDRLSIEVVATRGLPPLRAIGPQAAYLHQ